jgi:hypothetical protein
MTMAPAKKKATKRNAVAVRFDDDELAEVERAAGDAKVSPWVREAAVEKAQGVRCRCCPHAEAKGSA